MVDLNHLKQAHELAEAFKGTVGRALMFAPLREPHESLQRKIKYQSEDYPFLTDRLSRELFEKEINNNLVEYEGQNFDVTVLSVTEDDVYESFAFEVEITPIGGQS